jgi:hypothetical protein
MAYRRSRGKATKVQPAVLTLTFQEVIPAGAEGHTAVDQYIDLGQTCSILNRRFYRQGLNWAVAGIKVLSQPAVVAGVQNPLNGNLTVSQLPTTWPVFNGWVKAFSVWRKQQDEALEAGGSESMKARFNDFKIFMDRNHASAGMTANLIPINFHDKDADDPTLSGTVQEFNVGTWQASQIVLPNTTNVGTDDADTAPTERFLHMVGKNTAGTNSRGILEGYADSRARPHSPDPVGPDVGDADNWMARMFDVGSDMEEVLDNATLINDDLPYDKDDYPNGEGNAPGVQIHDFQLVTGTTVGGTTWFSGGTFPCGLIKLTHENFDTQNVTVTIQVQLVPGQHRGYLCQPMQDV